VAAKSVINNRTPELCALTRVKWVKLERNEGRAKTLASLEVHNHSKIKKLHEEKKDEPLLLLNMCMNTFSILTSIMNNSVFNSHSPTKLERSREHF
jgi:hypothetical protein